jgi:hypothetical protein
LQEEESERRRDSAGRRQLMMPNTLAAQTWSHLAAVGTNLRHDAPDVRHARARIALRVVCFVSA